jgi:quinone-modifying oxidoreductase subunit QmoC
MSCLQCGACTARCNLGEGRHRFPQRQMTLLQLGLKEELVADLSIWLCFNCGECSTTCPVNVRPGNIMAGIRQMAVEHYATPRFAASLFDRARYRPLAFLPGIALLLAVILFGGSLAPQTSPVHFASMLPHRTLNLFFGAVAGFVILGASLGATRAWKTLLGETLLAADPRRFLRSAWAASGEILTQRRAKECQQFPLSRWAHLSILYGFLTLLALSGVAAILVVTGAPYPLPAWHPFKILANLGAALLIAGTVYFLFQRQRDSRKGNRSSWSDWALLADLLLVGVTGVLTEVFRYSNSARLAYPTYFVHLACVLVLLASLPYSKLAHAVYRGLALTALQYQRRTV